MSVYSLCKKTGLFFMIAALALLGACAPTPAAIEEAGQESDETEKIVVYTTFYPLYYVADRISGELADVRNVIPAGVEPHDYEPTAKDIVAMSAADVFVYNGNGLEQWVENALNNFDTSQMIVVKATEGIELLPADEHEHGHGHGDDHDEHAAHEGPGHNHDEESHIGHDHGEFDPHVWLDLTLLVKQAELIKKAMSEADPSNTEAYQKNYESLEADLLALDQQFAEMVSDAKRHEFVVSHRAFSYLAERYGLEQISISGLSPDVEPTPSRLKALIEYVKAKEINYILFETLVSPKVAEVIARETGAKTATLNPLEGLTKEELDNGEDFLSIMQANLETLRMVLNE